MAEQPVSDPAASGWVWSGNLRPFMEVLGRQVSYRFDDVDGDAIETGLPATDDERQDGWFSYPLVGTVTVTVWLARAVGGDEVVVRIEDPAGALAQSTTTILFDVFSSYNVG